MIIDKYFDIPYDTKILALKEKYRLNGDKYSVSHGLYLTGYGKNVKVSQDIIDYAFIHAASELISTLINDIDHSMPVSNDTSKVLNVCSMQIKNAQQLYDKFKVRSVVLGDENVETVAERIYNVEHTGRVDRVYAIDDNPLKC